MVSMDTKAPPPSNYSGPYLRLHVRDVREGKKRAITIRSWATIKDLKDLLQQVMHVPPSAQRLYFGPLLTSGKELPNHRTMHDAGIYRSGETLLLDIKRNSDDVSAFSSMYALRSTTGNDICISSSMMENAPVALKLCVQQARRGFALGLKPEFILDGSGGTYFLHDARKNKIAVFKPADEEPYAINNPRGYLPQSGQHLALRAGVPPGEACIREVAAYMLDYGGMAGVPMTTLTEARHPSFNNNGSRLKVLEGGASIGSHSIASSPAVSAVKKAGSFQEFVRAECTMDDMSPSLLSAEEVHKIAILDIRIMNADRNSANLLCRRRRDDSLELVPIDHGYCLRSECGVSWMDWCWLDWPQLKEPMSTQHKKFILNLDIEADARMLKERLNICQEAIDCFRASSALLKAGVKAGLSLYEIAIMCCRNDNLGEVPSKLEMLSSMAYELATIVVENKQWDHSAASRAMVDQLSPNPQGRSAARCFRRSQSSGEMLQLSVDSLDDDEPNSLGAALARHEELEDDEPGIMQSSASDASVESNDDTVDEVVKEECEFWAATVLADVSHEQSNSETPVNRANRSGSVASEDSDSGLSSSPKGFWHIRPGTSPASLSDDDSVNWEQSPLLAPRAIVSLARPPSPLTLEQSTTPKLIKPSVQFAVDIMGPFIPPETVEMSEMKSSPPPLLLRESSGTMPRRKSYTALSSASSDFSGSSHSSSDMQAVAASNPKVYQHFRSYFLKFIDLVVAREMTTAVHSKP